MNVSLVFLRFMQTCALLGLPLTLAACSGADSSGTNSGEAAVDKASTAQGKVEALLEGVDSATRTSIEAEVARYRTSMDEVLKTLLAKKEPDRSNDLAKFVFEGQSAVRDAHEKIDRIAKNLENAGPAKTEFQSGQHDKMNAAIARYRVFAAVGQGYIDQAVSESPLLREAMKRHLNSRTTDGGFGVKFGDAVTDVKIHPCSIFNAKGASPSPISIRGVELGMTRDQALSAICEAQKGEVILIGDYSKSAYEDLERRRNGAHLVAESEFRNGKGTYNALLQSIEQDMLSKPAQNAMRELGTPYLSQTDLCLGCKNWRDALDNAHDNLKLTYGKDGKIVSIRRENFFVASTKDGNSLVQREAPQPLGPILNALKQQYGEPSLHVTGPSAIHYAWVRPEGAAALPTEDWLWELVDTHTRMGRSPSVSLNGQRLTAVDGKPIASKVAAMNPAASYCVFGNHLLFGDTSPDGRITGNFQYGSPIRRWSGETVITKNGKDVLSMPYDKLLESPGYRPQCGRVMVAALYLTRKNSRGFVEPGSIKPDAPVYGVEIRLTDVDAMQANAKQEVAAIKERVAAANQRLDQAATAPNSAFKP